MSPDPERRAEADAHIRRAEVLLLQAAMAAGEARETLHAEAYDVLVRAEVAAAGSASWRIACLCARQGRSEHCRKWLERSRRIGDLPDRTVIESHGDMEKVRAQKWFRRFLDEL